MKVFVVILGAVCCVQIIQALPSSCEFDNSYVAKHNDKELKNVNLEQCKRECITSRNCKSADYQKSDRRCALSSLSYSAAKKGDFVRPDKNFKLISVCPKVSKLHAYDGLYVGVNNYNKVVRDVDINQCLTLCETDPKCVHAEYIKDKRKCQFSEKSCQYFHDNDLVRKSKNHVLIAACPFRSTCHFDNTFIARRHYKEIRSVTEDQCRFECMTDPERKCKSAKYNKKISRCFMMDMTYLQAKEQHLVRENQRDFSLISECPTVEDSNILEYESRYIAQNNYANIPHMLKEECKTACILDPKCKTAEYRAKDKRCFLSQMSCGVAKQQNLIRDDKEYVLFGACPLAKNCVRDNSYISGTGYRVLKNTSGEVCKRLCLSDPKDNCLHVEYDKKKERCEFNELSYKDAQRRDIIRASKNYRLYYAC